jgi:gingipain R
MKSLNVILIIILCIGVSLSAQWKSISGPEDSPVTVNVLDDDASETVIEFNVAGYNEKSISIENNSYLTLSVPEASIFLEKGYPELPRVNRSIVIPNQAKMSIEIVEAIYDTMDGVLIAPSKGSLPRSIDPQTVPYTFSDFYETNTFWPENIVELSLPFLLRDMRGITVRFNLFRHNAMRKQLIVCRHMVVRVYSDGMDDVNVKQSQTTHPGYDFDKLYQRFFLNYSKDDAKSLKKAAYDDIEETGRMLIIAADDFYDSMIPLRDWRTRKGYRTTLVKCSDVGTTDDAIQDYIQDMYDEAGSVTYILLVGEGSDVPSKGVPYFDYPYSPTAPKDPKYTYLNDDPGTIEYPDAYISRLSAENVAQVENQVRRIIKYETDPASGSWLQKACGIASHQGSLADSTRCNWLRDDLLGYGYTTVDKLYDITSAAPITSAMNSGRGVVNFIGHGIETEWGFNYPYVWPLFSISDVQSLSNTNLLPFIFSVACEVGSFPDYSTCFAEAWLRSGSADSPTGAIGFYGSSIGQPWVEPCVVQAEAVDLLVADDKITIGGLCFNGSCKMIEDYPSTGPGVFNTWHIFGDAATHVWTDTPSEFANVTVYDDGEIVYVNANTSGCDICVSSGNNGEYYHSVVHNVSSTGFETPPRPLYITVTKHNNIPYTAVTGGNFTSDETWFGNLHLLGTVTVSGHGSLTLLPGTRIQMDGYYTIATYDNACLIAEGTEADPILFTSTSGTTPQSWNRLYLRTDNNSLKWCEIEYSDWGIHAIGYPSSGNVFENCTLHDNDQGVRIEQNTCDVINCDIYDNRHNVVTINNPQVNISGTRITDGGRDGIYSASGNLLNLYGNVIENNGTGGTITRNGLRTGYGDIVYVGKISYPNWQGYNTIRNNYQNEIYASSGLGGIQVFFSSVHDNSGYEIYNASVNNPSIQSMFSWWGEFPPNSNQFYGNVSITDELECQPAWEGQTFSGQQFSKSGVLPAEVMTPQEQITLLKQMILDETEAGQADSALTALFNIIRTDFVTNAYHERDGFFQYLSSIYNSEDMSSIGERALKYMILWKTLEGDISEAVRLSEIALEGFDQENRQEIMANLSMLYAYSAQFDKAEEMVARYEKQYGHDTSGIEFLVTAIADYKTMYLEEQKLYKDGIAPDSHPKDSQLPEEFALWPNYPNPFNPATTIRYSLPEAGHVILYIYDITGRLVEQLVNQNTPAGFHTVTWDATSYSSGVYIARLKAGSSIKTQKMVLMK